MVRALASASVSKSIWATTVTSPRATIVAPAPIAASLTGSPAAIEIAAAAPNSSIGSSRAGLASKAGNGIGAIPAKSASVASCRCVSASTEKGFRAKAPMRLAFATVFALATVLARTTTSPSSRRLGPPMALPPPTGPPAAIAAPNPTSAPDESASAFVVAMAVWLAVTRRSPEIVVCIAAGVSRAIVSFMAAVRAIAAGRLPSLFTPASASVVVVEVPLAVTRMSRAPTTTAAPISASAVCLMALTATEGPTPTESTPSGVAVAIAR